MLAAVVGPIPRMVGVPSRQAGALLLVSVVKLYQPSRCVSSRQRCRVRDRAQHARSPARHSPRTADLIIAANVRIYDIPQGGDGGGGGGGKRGW